MLSLLEGVRCRAMTPERSKVWPLGGNNKSATTEKLTRESQVDYDPIVLNITPLIDHLDQEAQKNELRQKSRISPVRRANQIMSWALAIFFRSSYSAIRA